MIRTLLPVLALVFVVLAVTNPNSEDFSDFVERRARHVVLEETGDTALGRVLSGAGGGLAAVLSERVTTRRNYVVFSTYTIDLDGEDEEGEEWTFVGIVGRFVEVEQPASFRDREEHRQNS